MSEPGVAHVREPAFRHVVVGVDFCAASEAAVRWACRHFAGAELSLVHVVRVPPLPSFVGGEFAERRQNLDDIRHAAERRLEEFADALGVSSARRIVETGRPSERMVRATESLDADVIVVGAHGKRKRLARMLGSTAELVLRTATRPVLLARGLPTESPRRVLIGVDDSDVTPTVVAWARHVCAHFGADAMLLHVVDSDLIDAISIAGRRTEVRRARERLRTDAARWLSQHADVLREAGIHVTADVTFGDPASKLLVRSTPPRADLVLIGRRGAGHIQRAILGGLADRVIRLGTSPTFVVPEPQHV